MSPVAISDIGVALEERGDLMVRVEGNAKWTDGGGSFNLGGRGGRRVREREESEGEGGGEGWLGYIILRDKPL